MTIFVIALIAGICLYAYLQSPKGAALNASLQAKLTALESHIKGKFKK